MFYKKLAYYDILCNCYNRNFLELKLKKQYAKKATYITIVDIDNFKYINDNFGHQKGDEVLVTLIKLLNRINGIKFICRYGGDEFIVFHDTDDVDFSLQQRIFVGATNATFSYGTVYKNETDSFDEILRLADQGLYKEKDMKKQINMNETEVTLPNLVWFYAMNRKLTNEEWNEFCKRVSEADLEDKVFKTSSTEYEQYIKDFLDGKYIVVRKDN